MTRRDKKPMKTLSEYGNLDAPPLQRPKHGQKDPKSLLNQARKHFILT